MHVNVVGARRRGSAVLMLGHRRHIGPASVWRLVVACANPVLHPDLTHSVLLCSYPASCGGYSFKSHLSVCPGK